jgi:hypothetical protein
MEFSSVTSWASVVSVWPRLALSLMMIVGCGGQVDAPPTPLQKPPTSEPTGRVVGSVTVRLGTSASDVHVDPLATSVFLFPVQPLLDGLTGPIPTGQPVAHVESGSDGRYSIDAPPGVYTLLAFWNGKYSPRAPAPEGWNPVRIDANSSTEMTLLERRSV